VPADSPAAKLPYPTGKAFFKNIIHFMHLLMLTLSYRAASGGIAALSRS
jgi:hypothetical protein